MVLVNKQLLPKQIEQQAQIQRMGASEQKALDPMLRVLVWNIFKAKRSNWLSDFTQLSRDCNLVLLQEAISNAPTDGHFNSSVSHEWVMAGSHQHPVSDVVTGVKSGSTAEAQKVQVHRSNYYEPVVKTQKLLLETHYSLAEKSQQLMVLNMHAINFVGVRKYVDQLEQLQGALKSHSGPVLLAGDFNTWNPKRLSLFRECAAEANLVEASMARRSNIRHLHQHLDHVFYRGLSLYSIESLANISSSDHAPIKATFRVD